MDCWVILCQRSSKEFIEETVSRRVSGMCSSVSSKEKIVVIIAEVWINSEGQRYGSSPTVVEEMDVAENEGDTALHLILLVMI